jgi:hypothetical protein
MTHQVKKTFNGWLVDGRKHGRSNGEVHNMRNATQKVIFKDGSIYFYWNDMLLRSHRWNDGSIEHFGQQMRLTGFCKIIDNGEHISIRCFLESGGSGISYFRQNKPL